MASYEKRFDPWNYFYCLSISLISSSFLVLEWYFFSFDVRKKLDKLVIGVSYWTLTDFLNKLFFSFNLVI